MTLSLAQTLLFVSQLVYVSDRWLNLTKQKIENRRSERMRKVVDWKRRESLRK
ncbi:hypothetical protein [Marivita sp.]|uniref:hypothetical protein n=1 Tax=Marivita sp. TaxID=2003365 RepID=UPI0025C2AE72|nr:hypothetical protein [Marivita sp.]